MRGDVERHQQPTTGEIGRTGESLFGEGQAGREDLSRAKEEGEGEDEESVHGREVEGGARVVSSSFVSQRPLTHHEPGSGREVGAADEKMETEFSSDLPQEDRWSY